jgi:hypothetical protein
VTPQPPIRTASRVPARRESAARVFPSAPIVALALSVALWGLTATADRLDASQVKIFQTQTREAFIAGTLEGVGVDSLGRLELADRVERLTAVSEPFVFSGAAHPEGWVLGTGNAGKVLLVTRAGEVRELFAADEPEVFALWVDPDGTVFAGTSPEGKVYRIPMDGATPGEAEVVAEPGETYIWALARDRDGGLLVATGTQGRLYRVDRRGETRVVYDSDDTHLRSLLVRQDGDLLVGTAGEGLVLRLSPTAEGEYTARTLYDADKPEVVALTAGPDGTAYAGLLASEASLVDLSSRPSASPSSSSSSKNGGDEKGDGGGDGEGPQVAGAEVSVTEPGAVGSRRAGFKGARSEILGIFPGGRVESLWELDEETLFTLLWARDGLWVGTGLEGKLYRWSAEEEMVLETDVDERQVVALMEDRPGPAFATTNAAAVYRVTGTTEREGTYTSPTLDAGQIARFGRFSWRGEIPRHASLSFSFRSGMSSEPDRTWSPWTDPRRGEEIQVADLPPGRYVQWRAHFRAGDSVSPRLFGAELSYLQQNLAPKIERLQVLDPGQVLVPANFNPTSQVFEPAHPNREGIFTTLEPGERAGGRLKPLWKQGYRTLRWEVEDPNDDHLRFRLDFRPETEGAAGDEGGDGESAWMPVVEDLEDEYYSFDATVLPDGVYRFRLRASDADDNAGDGRTGERVSEPVVVDHTPPRRGAVRHQGGMLRVEVEDALSPLREAVVSLDAGEWRPVAAGDGLLDGRRETLEIPLPGPGGEGPRLVLLRVTDAAHNVVTFDLTGELP